MPSESRIPYAGDSDSQIAKQALVFVSDPRNSSQRTMSCGVFLKHRTGVLRLMKSLQSTKIENSQASRKKC